MGSNTLNNRSSGQTILDTFFNDIHSAMNGDFVGRNSSGVPASGQNLGTVALPWGTINAGSLVLNGSAVDTSKITSPVNRIVSGKKRSTSNQPAFITPNGAAASFIVAGLTTNLVYDVNGTRVAITTDITKASLTTAPNTSNTAVVNDSVAAGQSDTRLWGEPEHNKTITIGTVGSNISNAIGTFQTFKIGSEYFLAFVESGTVLSRCRRGYFYDSSLNPVNRSTFSNGATITLMKTGWVFADADATTIDVTYNNPTWNATQPTSPATGDYWYDTVNSVWKRYDGASFQIISRTFIGIVVLDATNCVAARSVHFYADYRDYNTVELEIASGVVRGLKPNMAVNVAGNLIQMNTNLWTWNASTMLAASTDMYNASLQASTIYYLYVSDTGQTKISDISPYYRGDFIGAYHPHNPWRCVGVVYSNGSSVLTNPSSFYRPICRTRLRTSNGGGAVDTGVIKWSVIVEDLGSHYLHTQTANNGDIFTVVIPCVLAGSCSTQVNNGWTKNANSTDLTTDMNTLASDNKLASEGASGGGTTNFLMSAKIGDIFRAQGSPAGMPASSRDVMQINVIEQGIL